MYSNNSVKQSSKEIIDKHGIYTLCKIRECLQTQEVCQRYLLHVHVIA